MQEQGIFSHFNQFTYLILLLSFLSTVGDLRQRRDPSLPPFLPPLGSSSDNMQANVCLAVEALLDADPLGGGEELRDGGREGGREGEEKMKRKHRGRGGGREGGREGFQDVPLPDG